MTRFVDVEVVESQNKTLRLKYSVQAACFTPESENLPHCHGKNNVAVADDDNRTSCVCSHNSFCFRL